MIRFCHLLKLLSSYEQGTELCVGFDFCSVFCHKELPDCSLFYDVTPDKEQSVENTTLEFIALKLKQWSI